MKNFVVDCDYVIHIAYETYLKFIQKMIRINYGQKFLLHYRLSLLINSIKL